MGNIILKTFLLFIMLGTVSVGTWPLIMDQCSLIIQSFYDPVNENYYGFITISAPDEHEIHLSVDVSVFEDTHGEEGQLKMLYPNSDPNYIKKQSQVVYYLYYPGFTSTFPVVSRISVNKQVICAVNKPIASVRIINIHHEYRAKALKASAGILGAYTTQLPNEYVYLHTLLSGIYNPYNFYPKGVPPPNFKPAKELEKYNANNKEVEYITESSIFWTTKRNPGIPNLENSIFWTSEPISSLATPENSIFWTTKAETFSTTTERSILKKLFKFDEMIPKVETHSTDFFPFYPEICGTSQSSSYPWLFAIYEHDVMSETLRYKCSGTLLTNRHVLTGAHCAMIDAGFVDPEELILVWERFTLSVWNGTIFHVKKIIINPNFDISPFTADADLAVLVLQESIEFNDYIKPICLWTGPIEKDDSWGTVIGWGRREKDRKIQIEAYNSTIPIVDREECLRSKSILPHVLSDRTFCAGKRGQEGPCTGVSGGSFIVKRNNRWVVRGIVSLVFERSFESSCNSTNSIVLTDTAKHSNWILEAARQ